MPAVDELSWTSQKLEIESVPTCLTDLPQEVLEKIVSMLILKPHIQYSSPIFNNWSVSFHPPYTALSCVATSGNRVLRDIALNTKLWAHFPLDTVMYKYRGKVLKLARMKLLKRVEFVTNGMSPSLLASLFSIIQTNLTELEDLILVGPLKGSNLARQDLLASVMISCKKLQFHSFCPSRALWEKLLTLLLRGEGKLVHLEYNAMRGRCDDHLGRYGTGEPRLVSQMAGLETLQLGEGVVLSPAQMVSLLTEVAEGRSNLKVLNLSNQQQYCIAPAHYSSYGDFSVVRPDLARAVLRVIQDKSIESNLVWCLEERAVA